MFSEAPLVVQARGRVAGTPSRGAVRVWQFAEGARGKMVVGVCTLGAF